MAAELILTTSATPIALRARTRKRIGTIDKLVADTSCAFVAAMTAIVARM